jgi:hypothetical protein
MPAEPAQQPTSGESALPRFRLNMITRQPLSGPGPAQIPGHPAAWMRSKKSTGQGAKPMDGSPLRVAPEDLEARGLETSLPDPGGTGRAPELDLERLVWDPEYRKAMRPLIKRGS